MNIKAHFYKVDATSEILLYEVGQVPFLQIRNYIHNRYGYGYGYGYEFVSPTISYHYGDIYNDLDVHN